MRKLRFCLSWKSVAGIICIVLLIPQIEAIRGSAVVLQAKTKAAELKQESENGTIGESSLGVVNATKSPLTGIPQIDYLLDPNLPRELNGHNLTDYPFYNAVPEEIDFKCDGLHDGFYASVVHKCQVYHHCLYGTRYDFLCANYTAFDQRTFICHFVSEVDCDNSPKYFIRNEALYKEASTTTTSTTTTTTTTTTAAPAVNQQNGGGENNGRNGNFGGGGGQRRRRPYRRRRPMYDYYYDDEEYADTEYYEDDPLPPASNYRRNPSHGGKHKFQSTGTGNEGRASENDYEVNLEQVKPNVRNSNVAGSVYERPRTPPKIRRPVPKNEREKYEYVPKQQTSASSSVTSPSTEPPPPVVQQKQSPNNKNKQPQNADEEYYDEEEYDYVAAADTKGNSPKSKPRATTDYEAPSGYGGESRRYQNRFRSRIQPVRKRTEMIYDDYELEERPLRTNRRKVVEHASRYDGERRRNPRPSQSSHRLLKSSKTDHSTGPRKRLRDYEHRSSNNGGRRVVEQQPVLYDDEYYYDDEKEEPIKSPKRNLDRPSPGDTNDRENEETVVKQLPENSVKKSAHKTGLKTSSLPPPVQRNSKTVAPVLDEAEEEEEINKNFNQENENLQEGIENQPKLKNPVSEKHIKIPTEVSSFSIQSNNQPQQQNFRENLNTNLGTNNNNYNRQFNYNESKNPKINQNTENFNNNDNFQSPNFRKYTKLFSDTSTTSSVDPNIYYNNEKEKDFVGSDYKTVLEESAIANKMKAIIPNQENLLPNNNIKTNKNSSISPHRHFTVVSTRKLIYFTPEPPTNNDEKLQNQITTKSTIQPTNNYQQHTIPTLKYNNNNNKILQNSNLYLESEQNSRQNLQIRTESPPQLQDINNSYNKNVFGIEMRENQFENNNNNQNVPNFPQRPPVTYDITAPGPSAPQAAVATDIVGGKKYSELYPSSSYVTANEDYDATINDPIHPVTNYRYFQQQNPSRTANTNNNRLLQMQSSSNNNNNNYNVLNNNHANVPRSHERYTN